MNNKWWCFFGVHEYEIFDTQWVREDHMIRGWKSYHRLYIRCKCCGKVKFKNMG
ncbi:hypothetical protein HPMBJEAJ_00004 [Aeromonas phage avDM6]|nr:hypothetical protein HPMBJEAJ_00004 [Aeromonas phage avDM6]